MVGWMVFHIIIALVTYAFFPRVPVLGKAIPASLAAIIITTILEWGLIRPIGYKTNTVEDLQDVRGDFPIPVWSDSRYSSEMPPINGETIGIIFPVAITVAAIGLLESLLTLEIIDEMTNTKGNGNREALGQGLGNLLSGIFGGMGGCTTIGQSMMNIHSGGVYQAFFYLCGYLHVAHYSSGLSIDQLDSYRWIGGSHVCCDILYD